MRPNLLFSFFTLLIGAVFLLPVVTPPSQSKYDVIIRNGTIYDGSGGEEFVGDIGIIADTIAFVGNLSQATADREIDARGRAVAPGFINMLSWADQTLLRDGRSMSDLKQGVTLEVFGEGWSPGPVKRPGNKTSDSLFTTLDGYFRFAMKKGISCNIASFVGATSVRIHELGYEGRHPSPAELARMKQLVADAMEQGAMGLGSSLIYAPANYASTEELIELSKVAASYGGMYITHMRSESDMIFAALRETFRISKEANIPAEIYHLKVNNPRNWPKIDTVLAMIDSVRSAGLAITANMYPYIASGTGLSARLPLWVQEGGARQMRKRLRNPELRRRVLDEMERGIPSKNSAPENVVLTGFRLDSLNKLYRGKKLSEVAQMHGKNADETVIDLIVRDKSRIEALYFLQSEDNLRKIIQKPFVSFGSDAGSYSLSADSALLSDHPRAFGTFARVLGKYVRQEKLITLNEAIHRLTAMPAANLKIPDRGRIMKGYYADLVVFDAAAITDLATFEAPHRYATGVDHVFVNGVQVLANGEHTGAMPGRVVRGPGFKARKYSF